MSLLFKIEIKIQQFKRIKRDINHYYKLKTNLIYILIS